MSGNGSCRQRSMGSNDRAVEICAVPEMTKLCMHEQNLHYKTGSLQGQMHTVSWLNHDCSITGTNVIEIIFAFLFYQTSI